MLRISVRKKTRIITPITVLALFNKPITFISDIIELGILVVFRVVIANSILFNDKDNKLLIIR
jgi:hypothetical protein